MKFSAKQIAEILEGNVVGNGEVEVSKLSKIEEGTKDSLTFLSNPKYTSFIYTTQAGIVIVNQDFEPTQEISSTLIKVKDAYLAFTQLLEFYNQYRTNKEGKENPYHVGDSVIPEDAYVGAFVHIGNNVKIGSNVKLHPHTSIADNVTIGDNVTLNSGVKVYMDCVIGDNVTVHSGAIIGADGFGFAPNENGVYKTIPQIGNVVIGNNVDIGANTTIDRATMGSTIIEDGVKLDNQIQIGHNVVIGKHTVIAAQTAIAGSSKVGAYCMIGGQVAISGHLKVGNKVRIAGKAGITKSVKDNQVVMGTPAFDHKSFMRSYSIFKNLPKTIKEINQKLEKLVSQDV